ncbi:MAG: hypothetical protein AAB407_03925 [Patescibacteria group bacterium]
MSRIQVKKREGESPNALIFRFTKRTKQSGVLREARKRRFRSRPKSRIKRRLSAIHRDAKKKEFERAKKMGSA